MEPVLLSPDNWTPPSRTPWGGRALLALKERLAIADDKRLWRAVGESWELSVDPQFPSTLADGTTLAAAIARDRHAWLGATPEPSTPLLVKLIDAAEALSFQVHPHDDDPALAPHESGKPECWVILRASPGAGVFLGFEPGVTRADVDDALDRDASLTTLLTFVPVVAGDAFTITPGTVHAIGAGVTLLEAQLVRPGRSGVTYRFWDWNRGRPLHRERAMAVATFAPAHDALVPRSAPAPGVSAVLAFAGMHVERVRGPGRAVVGPRHVLQAVVALADLTVNGVPVPRGQTLAIPAATGALTFELGPDAEAWLVRVE